jgi:dCMP deaminase
MIINSGIETVIIRNTEDEYTVTPVSDWIENDDSLGDTTGY